MLSVPSLKLWLGSRSLKNNPYQIFVNCSNIDALLASFADVWELIMLN